MAVRRPIQTIDLSLGDSKTLKAGEAVVVPLGKCMPEYPHRVTFELANASGGAVVLSEAQRIALLAHVVITVQANIEGYSHKPYDAKPLSRMRDLERELLSRECVGFADSVSGLATSLPDAATTEVEVQVAFPTGRNNRIAQLRQGIGIGPTQAKAYEITYDVAGVESGLPAGITIAGLTIEPIPDLDSCVGDPWVPFGVLTESNKAGTELVLPDGFAELVYLKDAAHVSTPLTEMRTGFDQEVFADRTDPQLFLSDVQKPLRHEADADISDRVTYLHTLPQEVDLVAEPERVPTGRFFFEDKAEDLATVGIDYGHVVRPILKAADYFAIHTFVAATRAKSVRGVNTFAVRGLDTKAHDRFSPYFGVTFFTGEDRQFHQFPAWWGGPEEKPGQFTPPVVKAQLARAVKAHQSAGAGAVGQKMLDRAAVALPTTVQSGRGMKHGSPARTAFEAKVMRGD